MIGPSAIVLERSKHTPMEATLWTPSYKIEMLTFQFIYMTIELLANHMGSLPQGPKLNTIDHRQQVNLTLAGVVVLVQFGYLRRLACFVSQ